MRDVFGITGGPARWWGIVLFGTAVALSVAGIWLLSGDARREIDALATASGDTLQWSLSQAELEHSKLMTAALRASADDAESLTTLRRRFDVFYSRMGIVERATAFDPLRAEPAVKDAIARSKDFLSDFVGSIDGSDAQLSAALSELRTGAAELEQDLRLMSLAGVKVFAQLSEDQRIRVADALFDLAMLLLFLGIVLVGLIVLLAQLLSFTRRQRARIERAQGRLQSIVATSLDGVVVVGRDDRVLEMNDAAERIFGYSREEALGRRMASLFIPQRFRGAHADAMQRHLKTGQTRMIDSGLVQLTALRRDGTEFPVELSISTAQSDRGEIFISFIRDISARVAAEQELVEARDRAVLGEKAKADLLAVMSHEMRTPLNGILGTLELLQATELTDRQRNFGESMRTSGQMLLRHVNDVLDVSRMDAEISEAARDPFDLVALVHSVRKSLESQAKARGNKLKVKFLGPVPRQVLGDRGRLEQVLVNLLGNATKFTENGRITIEVEATPGSDDVELRVIDTGIGIEEAELEHIFEDFVTLDASYSRSTEGTGLGLGIARRLVDVLGGEIGVESEIGDGSVFWVRVPLPADPGQSTSEPDEAMPLTAPRFGRDVLLVEDNEINRMVAREMLAEQGCRVVEATDGISGVERAAARRFDLILMDINMPQLDGLSAAERIQSGDGPNRATPIVALTANALPEDIRRFEDAGFADVIVKPLSRRRLAGVLSGSFGAPSAAIGPEGTADEFEQVLGSGEAARVRRRAIDEICHTLEGFENGISSSRGPRDIAQDLHRMVGLAGLVGLQSVHARLVSLQSRVDGKVSADFSSEVADIRASLRDEAHVA